MDNDQEPALRHVLDRYGLAGATLAPLAGGMINEVYRIEAGGKAYALKKYRLGPNLFERVLHVWGVQESVRLRGIPVPALVRTLAGERVTETDAGVFVLSEFVEGRQYPPGTMPGFAAERMGEVLARLLGVLSDIPAPEVQTLPDRDWIAAHLQQLLAVAEKRRHSDPVDEAAYQILMSRLHALERWEGAAPATAGQWMHGDYQWRNVLFGEDDQVVAVIDFDNLRTASAAHEVMRCFTLAFPSGAPEALAFFRGYARVSSITPEGAAAFVRHWRYTSLFRTWPISARYQEPEAYQARWDEFIRPPTGWWEANWQGVSERLADIARAPDG